MLKPEHEPAGLINKGDYVMNIEEKKQIRKQNHFVYCDV